MNDYVAGSTSIVETVFIQDSASTTGGGKAGLAYNTASLTCYYKRSNGTASVSVTLADITTLGTFVSGGFKAIDGTNMPGLYEFHPPDAAVASGAKHVTFYFQGASGMVPRPIKVRILAVNPDDSVRFGLTALPNAAAEAAGGLYTRGTGAGQINQANNGQIDANAARLGGTTQTGRDIGTSVLLSSGTGTGQVSLSGGLVSLSGTQTFNVTGNITGNLSGSVGSVTGAVGSVTGAVGSVTGNVGGNVTGTVASVVGAVGSVTGNVGGNVVGTVASVVGAVGSVTGAVGSVTGDVGGNVVGSVGSLVGSTIALDTRFATIATTEATILGVCNSTNTIVGTNLSTLNDVQDDLHDLSDAFFGMVELDGSVYRYTANALEEGPASSGGGSGNGDIEVNHDTGGTDNLRYVYNGSGLDDATVRAYLASEYSAGIFTVRGQSITGSDGRWTAPMMLDANTYTFTFAKDGYELAVVTPVVVA